MERKNFTVSPSFLANFSLSCGYDAISSVKELIDNCIGAKATEIHIEISPKDKMFSISDNGCGMGERELKNNYYCVGESSTIEDEQASGKFGVGGKSAIINLKGGQPGTVRIYTRKNGSQSIYSDWKIDSEKKVTYVLEQTECEEYPVGTKIEFNYDVDIDVNELAIAIGTTYGWKMKEDDIKVYIKYGKLKEKKVKPQDPLYRGLKSEKMEGNKIIEKEISVAYCGKRYPVKITSVLFYNGVDKENCLSFDGGELLFTGKELGERYCHRRKIGVNVAKRSGFFVKSGGRYFTLGGNIDDITGITTHASYNGLRTEIDIPKQMWDLTGITWNKSKNIKCFKDIPEFFETEDGSNEDSKLRKDCVFGHIMSVMEEYRRNNKSNKNNDGKKDYSIIKNAFKNMPINGLNVTYSSNEEEADNFITLDGKTLTFNFGACIDIDNKMLSGIIQSVSIVLNNFISNGELSVAESIVRGLNFEYNAN